MVVVVQNVALGLVGGPDEWWNTLTCGISTELYHPKRTPAQRAPHLDNTPTSTRDNSTNMASIEAALAAIESLGLGEQFSHAQIARQYGVVRSTLTRRHQRVSA